MKIVYVIVFSLLSFLFVARGCSASTIKSDKPSTFIINGQDASAVVPSYAYLEIYRLPSLQGDLYFGSATLITPQVLLTVAQNLAGFGSWRVGLGGIRLQDLEWHVVFQAHPHPLYNAVTLANNIAVLQLLVPVQLSVRILPIGRLPVGSTFPTADVSLFVVGFGFGATAEKPLVLQEAQLTVITQEACVAAFPHLAQNPLLDQHFCATNVTTESNICAGDQGGPIISRDVNLLIGLQSFNRDGNCGSPESKPAAFIRVNQYTDFIGQFL